ncbi:hypothetical protein VTK73DRAFT_8472 [Phialemonium thermophilum]|uniref:Hedgehog/Intein (Hint) domain-containing protein n=1 Tax=Phialemonium thermophilum TaxID=223376 RepID=A0ABR3W8I9_9PEZI
MDDWPSFPISLFQRCLGSYHDETFRTDVALRVQNGDLLAVEREGARLVRCVEALPNRATQLPKAVRKSAHVFKSLGRYAEAIQVQGRILAPPPEVVVPQDLRIYAGEGVLMGHLPLINVGSVPPSRNAVGTLRLFEIMYAVS